MRAKSLLAGTALVVVLGGCSSTARPTATPPATPPSTATTSAARAVAGFAELERRYGARLGVAVVDTGDGSQVSYRAGERFPFASTNKAFIAAGVLHSGVDLDAVVHYDRSDLLEYAPVTSKHVATGMTLRALVDAALRYSDNTAANLLVERLGGPARVQAFLRSLGDATTSVDRLEPELNTAVPGDRRDTTTPATFARDLRAVALGAVLDARARSLLVATMRANTTGGPYIRAGVPAGWGVADKTGNADYGTRNDIAVVYPPRRAPVVVVLFSTRRTPDATSQDALLADATEVAVQALGA